MQYKLPTRVDVGNIQVEFESSYEPTGPFGVKSIGEVVINTPSPAIVAAVAAATGVQIREPPISGRFSVQSTKCKKGLKELCK